MDERLTQLHDQIRQIMAEAGEAGGLDKLAGPRRVQFFQFQRDVAHVADAASRLEWLTTEGRSRREREIVHLASILGVTVEQVEEETGGDIISSDELLRRLREQSRTPRLWGNWLGRGCVSTNVAPTGVAKTWLTHRMIWCLARGEPFLGMRPPHPLRILHVDLETPPPVKEEIMSYAPPLPPGHWDHVYMDARAARLKVHTPGYDLIVVDNLQSNRTIAGDENDNRAAHQEISRFKNIARKNRSGVWILYNSGKKRHDPKTDPPLHEWLSQPYFSRGGSEIDDRADVVINMYRVMSKDERSRKCWETHAAVAKGRLGSQGDFYRIRWLPDANYELVEHRRALETKEELYGEAAIKCIGLLECRSFIEIRDALAITPDSADEKALERGLRRMSTDREDELGPHRPLLLVGPGRVYERRYAGDD